MGQESVKVVSTNRKARFEYFVEDILEAGLALTGTEIKSVRAGHVSLQEAFVTIDHGEMWVQGMHIAPYESARRENHDPLRPRKLLLHGFEIARWEERARQRGFTIVPTRLYLKNGRAKLEIGLAKGKKLYDKRQAIAERDSKRNVARELGERRRRQR